MTQQHGLYCGRDEDRNKSKTNIKDNMEEEWEELVQIFGENKRKREEKGGKVQEKSSFGKSKKNRK